MEGHGQQQYSDRLCLNDAQTVLRSSNCAKKKSTHTITTPPAVCAGMDGSTLSCCLYQILTLPPDCYPLIVVPVTSRQCQIWLQTSANKIFIQLFKFKKELCVFCLPFPSFHCCQYRAHEPKRLNIT